MNEKRIKKRIENGWLPTYEISSKDIVKKLIINQYKDLYNVLEKTTKNPYDKLIWLLLKRLKSNDYNKMPKERRDNQNIVTGAINYSKHYGSNRNKIRVPSKKHKNRYKNFLKLFPNYA